MTSAAGLPFPQPALFSLSRKETVAEISLVQRLRFAGLRGQLAASLLRAKRGSPAWQPSVAVAPARGNLPTGQAGAATGPHRE
jgi:hypothetical protein